MGRLWETQSVEAVGFPWVFGKRPGVGAGGRGVRSGVCARLTLTLSCGTWRLKRRVYARSPGSE